MILRFLSLLAFLTGLLQMVAGVSRAESLTLAYQGQANYVITVPDLPSPVQITAAEELARYLHQITGADFTITPESETDAERLLAIGPSPKTAQLLAAAGKGGDSPMAYDGVRIARCGDSIVLSGHPVRGMLYAVYTFLENDLDCRWWTTSESTIPTNDAPSLDVTEVDYAPQLIYREVYFTGTRGAQNALFALRLRCNGDNNPIPPEYGSHHTYQYFVHSFNYLIPPEQYYNDHPDWFPEIDGVRKVGYLNLYYSKGDGSPFAQMLPSEKLDKGGVQLCLTNEGLFQEVLRKTLADLEQNPEATIISISQNDWHGYCNCAQCRAVIEEEGSLSGPLLRFVNRLAQEVEKVRPDVFIQTLAYDDTRTPPRVTKPRHNVIIQLCPVESAYGQPMTAEQNADFAADLHTWGQIAPHLFIWNYGANFTLYFLPFPNYRVWQPNIQFFVENNAIGFMEQGDYHLPTGDFVQLRAWVIAKLLWNPQFDQCKLMEEFIAGYYAPELVPIYMEYFDTLSDACEKSQVHLGIYRTSTADWFDPASVMKATALMNQARDIAAALAKANPDRYADLPRKVLRERIPLDLVWAQDWNLLKEKSEELGIEFLGPDDPLTAAHELFDRCRDFGITKHAENANPEKFDEFQQKIYQQYSEKGGSPQ